MTSLYALISLLVAPAWAEICQDHLTGAVVVRKATAQDVSQILEFIRVTRAEFGLLDGDLPGFDEELDDFVEFYSAPRGTFYVVQNAAQQIVGTAGFLKRAGDTVELQKVYLAPVLRGQGLGEHLVRQLMREARELGYSRMMLATSHRLKAAIQLYRKLGFRPIAHPQHGGADLFFALDL